MIQMTEAYLFLSLVLRFCWEVCCFSEELGGSSDLAEAASSTKQTRIRERQAKYAEELALKGRYVTEDPSYLLAVSKEDVWISVIVKIR